MTVIIPKEKPLWMKCKNPEFLIWYKKMFPKAFEREFLYQATPEEYAKHQVNKIFNKLRQKDKQDRDPG